MLTAGTRRGGFWQDVGTVNTVNTTPTTEVDLGLIATARRLAADGTARRIRETARLSEAEIGHVIGVAPSTISRWETGRRVPRGPAALRWAEILATLLEGDLR